MHRRPTRTRGTAPPPGSVPPDRVSRPARLAGAAVAALAMLLACPDDRDAPARDVEVRVGGVGLDPMTDQPVVVLREHPGGRSLPIWIGSAEARSIALELDHVELPRPNAHDLAGRLLTQLDAGVERMVVTDLRDGTYYAILVVRSGSRRIEVDARPSDAIAIALRVGAPLFVREDLLEAGAHGGPEDREEDPIPDGGLPL